MNRRTLKRAIVFKEALDSLRANKRPANRHNDRRSALVLAREKVPNERQSGLVGDDSSRGRAAANWRDAICLSPVDLARRAFAHFLSRSQWPRSPIAEWPNLNKRLARQLNERQSSANRRPTKHRLRLSSSRGHSDCHFAEVLFSRRRCSGASMAQSSRLKRQSPLATRANQREFA